MVEYKVHFDQPIEQSGVPLEDASAAVVLVHGRGDSAMGILRLSDVLDAPGVSFLAPQASGNTWYPYSFLAPIAQNEPGISSGVEAVARTIDRVREAGIEDERIVVLGFSQGACLAAETVARNPRRYGGLLVLSGGLIGTEDIPGAPIPKDKVFAYPGSLDETPVFLGCSDRDPHIPVDRVLQSAEVFTTMGGAVTQRIYEGMGHTINEDELQFANELLKGVRSGTS